MTEDSAKPSTRLVHDLGDRRYKAADGRFTVRAVEAMTIPALQRPNARKKGSQSRPLVLGWEVRYTDGSTVRFRTLRDVRRDA